MWDKKLIELLITNYKKHENLYDVCNPSYSDRMKREMSLFSIWSEIKELNNEITINDIKKKIHTMRKQFIRETHEIANKKRNAGVEDVYVPRLWFFPQLQFLKSHILFRKPEAKISKDEHDRKRKHDGSEKSDPSNAAENKKARDDKQILPAEDLAKLCPRAGFRVRRYMVQIPKCQLTIKTADEQELRKRYSSLGIPSDFFLANINWSGIFTPEKKFSLNRPCQFHIMQGKHNYATKSHLNKLEPTDANYLYSAKVMLLALPPINEIYKSCFENDDDPSHWATHPSRLMNFMVGMNENMETMAIGGPWSASLDGENPDKDPSVLIRTAIRTCKALTGINLSKCTEWHRFAEIFYHRKDGKKEDDYVETVVIYLPDVHSVKPSLMEWEILTQVYGKNIDSDNSNVMHIKTTGDSKAKGKTTKNKTGNDTITVIDDEADDEVILINEEHVKTMEHSDGSARSEKISTATKNNKNIQLSSSLALNKNEQNGLPASPHVIVFPNRQAKGGKFDCVIKPLPKLFDYQPEDVGESSFEISLFAELFNEMLTRDFGFNIYKEISLLKDPELPNNVCEVTLEKDEMPVEIKEEFKENDVKKSNENNSQVMTLNTETPIVIYKNIINPQLLLSFIYFDTTKCGYIHAKDLEDLFKVLGLKLSHSQINNLLKKLEVSDLSEPVYYKKFTHKAKPSEDILPIEVVDMSQFEPIIAIEDKSEEDEQGEQVEEEEDITYFISSEDDSSSNCEFELPSTLTEKELVLALINEYQKLPKRLKLTMEEIYNYKCQQKQSLFQNLTHNLNTKLQLKLSSMLVEKKLKFVLNLYENEIERRLTEDTETNSASQWLYDRLNFLEPFVTKKLKSTKLKLQTPKKPLEDLLLYELIEVYKKFKALWNLNYIPFYDLETRNELMQSLSDELYKKINISLDIDQLQKQINHIHTIFSKDKKQRIECEISKKDFEPQFPTFYMCNFLEDHEGPYKCSLCDYISETYKEHKLHHKSQHEGVKPYKCPKCPKSYDTKGYYKRHVKQHLEKKTSEKKNSEKKKLKKKKELLKEIKLRCKSCTEAFDSQEKLDIHSRSHVRWCNICAAELPHEKAHILHMSRHEEKPKYFCHICQEGFFLKISVTNHMKRHVHADDTVCVFCEKTFSNSALLYRHITRTHMTQVVVGN